MFSAVSFKKFSLTDGFREKAGMENITIFLKKSKISDIFDICDIYSIFLIVMFKNKKPY